MRVDIFEITFEGFDFVGDISLSSNGSRLLLNAPQEFNKRILEQLILEPLILSGNRLVFAKDNPKLFLQNLQNKYRNGQLHATAPIVKKSVEPTDIEALPIPLYLEDQFPVIPEGIDSIEVSEELEKALFGIFGRVITQLQRFKGKLGHWFTFGGRPVFVNVKGTKMDVSSGVSDAITKLAGNSMGKLPKSVTENISQVKIVNRLSTKVGGGKGLRLADFNPVSKEVRIYAPSAEQWMKAESVKGGLGPQRIMDNIVNHEAGHSLFTAKLMKPASFLPQSAKDFNVSAAGVKGPQFQAFSLVEINPKDILQRHGVSDYANFWFDKIDNPKGVYRLLGKAERQLVFANENFAEMHSLYRARTTGSLGASAWSRTVDDFPGQTKTFLDILEDVNAKNLNI